MAGIGENALSQAMSDALEQLDERRPGYREAVGKQIVNLIRELQQQGTEAAQRNAADSVVVALADAFPGVAKEGS